MGCRVAKLKYFETHFCLIHCNITVQWKESKKTFFSRVKKSLVVFRVPTSENNVFALMKQAQYISLLYVTVGPKC
jgi:hypothetical protein